MYFNNSVNFASCQFEKCIQELRSGLEPDTLALWYKRIKVISQRVIPEISTNDINFLQDEVLSMKFRIIISGRVIPYVVFIIEKNITLMPYSTGLYFRKVQELLLNTLEKYYLVLKNRNHLVMTQDKLEKKTKTSSRKKPRQAREKNQDKLEK